MDRRTSFLPAAIAAATVLLPAAVALAQEHAEHELSPTPSVNEGLITGITAIVVFLTVLAVLSVKVWPMMVKALDERAEKIRSEIEGAEQARQQAKDALEQYQRSLAEARA